MSQSFQQLGLHKVHQTYAVSPPPKAKTMSVHVRFGKAYRACSHDTKKYEHMRVCSQSNGGVTVAWYSRCTWASRTHYAPHAFDSIMCAHEKKDSNFRLIFFTRHAWGRACIHTHMNPSETWCVRRYDTGKLRQNLVLLAHTTPLPLCLQLSSDLSVRVPYFRVPISIRVSLPQSHSHRHCVCPRHRGSRVVRSWSACFVHVEKCHRHHRMMSPTTPV